MGDGGGVRGRRHVDTCGRQVNREQWTKNMNKCAGVEERASDAAWEQRVGRAGKGATKEDDHLNAAAARPCKPDPRTVLGSD